MVSHLTLFSRFVVLRLFLLLLPDTDGGAQERSSTRVALRLG